MAKWISGYVKSNGNDIFYTRTGGEKLPLLLAHGHTDDSTCWTDVAMMLEKDYDVIMYDAIGHGKSSRLSDDKPINLGLDMENVIKGLGLEKPAIWGHSMGAGTTVDYATPNADKISLIILEDVGWFEDDSFRAIEALSVKPYDIADVQKGTMEEAIELSKAVHPRHKDSVHKYWASSKMTYDLNWVKRKFKPTDYDWRKNASLITCPTLFLTADVDKKALMTPEVAVEALGLMRNAQWVHIPNAGHTIRYEQFTLTIGVVMNFLKQHYPPGK
jgi:N-formylmaleamate deformylase